MDLFKKKNVWDGNGDGLDGGKHSFTVGVGWMEASILSLWEDHKGNFYAGAGVGVGVGGIRGVVSTP